MFATEFNGLGSEVEVVYNDITYFLSPSLISSCAYSALEVVNVLTLRLVVDKQWVATEDSKSCTVND